MVTTDEAIDALCEVMAAKYGADADFRQSLVGMVAKVREAHGRRMRDALAAELLPSGPDACIERLGVARRTVYYMARRHRQRIRVQGSG